MVHMIQTNLSANIKEAIEKAGGPVATASLTGAKNYQAVQQWIVAGNVPSEYCPALETASGVSRLLLNKRAKSIWPELDPDNRRHHPDRRASRRGSKK
jgi:DNA-binding transcriptional regulator YdaS (Cro superfamily)